MNPRAALALSLALAAAFGSAGARLLARVPGPIPID